MHIIKHNMVFDDSLASKITAMVMGLAAEIERDFISMRTKDALVKRQTTGVLLGRPKRKAKKLKLDKKSAEVRKYLELGISKSAICKLVDCSASTLYESGYSLPSVVYNEIAMSLASGIGIPYGQFCLAELKP